MKQERQSNIELLRIIAMFLVLIVHADYASIGSPDIKDVEIYPISSFIRILVQSLSIVCVNVFVLVSGYFGVKPKLQSLANLIFQIVFFRILVCFVGFGLGICDITIGSLINIVPGYGDWFVLSYLLLVLFSPLINSYIENITSNQLLQYIIVFYLIQTVFGWMLPIWGNVYCSGYSFISMIGLYLIGRYIKLYGEKLQKIRPRYALFSYLLVSLLMATALFFIISTVENAVLLQYAQNRFSAYLSPIVIFASISLFLFVLGLKIRNRIVNWIAASVFSVYLIHCNPFVIDYYKKICNQLFQQNDTFQYLWQISVFIISVFILAVVVDQMRIWVWNNVVSRFIK